MRSLRSQFVLTAVLSTLTTLALAVLAVGTVFILGGRIVADETASNALRHHIEADMMHDALRADVLAALYAVASGERGVQDGIREDLDDHVKRFREAITANAALDLPAEIAASIAAVEAPLNQYVAAAEAMVSLAFGDLERARAALPDFLDRFSALEKTMEAASDEIQAFAGTQQAISLAIAARSKLLMLAMAALCLAIVLGGVLFAQMRVVRPMAAMAAVMDRLSAGDEAVAVPALGRGDEIGRMARAIQVFKDGAARLRAMQQDQAERDRRAQAEKKTALAAIANSFGSRVGGVVTAVSGAAGDLNRAAAVMAATAAETSRQSGAVQAASEQAAVNVQTVAAATGQLSASVQEIGRQVAESTRIAQRAVAEAGRTNASVEGLSAAAARIGEVVNLISAIASQTNLLALNATIEAARAGEAGKGFAVVASEVKSLANQTASATEEIGTQIAAIQAATRQSVDAIKGIAATIETINETTGAIATTVGDQGDATRAIAQNIQLAANDTRAVLASIVSVSRAATDAGAAAAQVRTSAEALTHHSDSLRRESGAFLDTLRAA